MYFSHGDTNARGVAIFIRKNIDFKLINKYNDSDGRLVSVILELEGKKLCIASVYAPNISPNPSDKIAHESFLELLFNHLHDMKVNFDISDFIVAGDFNIIKDRQYDAFGGSPTLYPKSIAQLNKIADEFALTDIFRELNPTDRLFTFSPGGLNVRNLFRRLDYIFIPETWTQDVMTTDTIPASHSDHKILHLTMRKGKNAKGSGIWRHNDLLNSNDEYLGEFKSLFPDWSKQANTLSDPRSRWDFIKWKMKTHSRDFSIRLKKKRTSFKDSVEKRLAKCDNELRANPDDREIAQRYMDAKTDYDVILEEENEQLRFRARVNVYEKSEKSTEYFFRQIKSNAARSNITTLDMNGKTTEDPTEINNAIYNYYKNLYKEEENVSERIATEKCDEFLTNDIPKISLEQQKACDMEITREEIRNILFKDLKAKKSPGNDGITVGLLKTQWDLLEPFFMECLNYAIETGELSATQKQGLVRLIEKKGKDRRQLENWRPISLLNVDLKILSKALANRIKKVLPDIISDEQTAFVKDRYIGENIQMIQGVMEYVKEKNESGLMLAIDFRKAFDSINHKFLFKSLKHFGFGDNFINMVRTLHNGAENAIMNGGVTTRYFKLGRSCRQGDCLSPYLFIIAIEALCVKIKNSKEIQGITCHKTMMKYSAYADDLTAFLKDRASFEALISTLKKFREISGLEINLGKTEGLILGIDDGEFHFPGLKLVQDIKITPVIFMTGTELKI